MAALLSRLNPYFQDCSTLCRAVDGWIPIYQERYWRLFFWWGKMRCESLSDSSKGNFIQRNYFIGRPHPLYYFCSQKISFFFKGWLSFHPLCLFMMNQLNVRGGRGFWRGSVDCYGGGGKGRRNNNYALIITLYYHNNHYHFYIPIYRGGRTESHKDSAV